jgi:palmitoyl-protein thioesterase
MARPYIISSLYVFSLLTPLQANSEFGKFGTPHFGISSLIPCPTPPTLTCLVAARAARSGIYTNWSQAHLIQAQYYRDPARIDEFLQVNTFLRDLNGEVPDGDSETSRHLERKSLDGLDNLVAVFFEADRGWNLSHRVIAKAWRLGTVSPAQSAHFATYSPDNKTAIIPMHDQPMYKNDWIGLRSLDEKNGLQLESCPGEHMDLDSGDCGMRMVRDWVGWEME